MGTRTLGSVLSGVALAAASVALGACDPPPPGYELILLRSPAGEPTSRPVAISDTGYVVGEVRAADGTPSVVRWAPDGTPTVIAAGQPGLGAQVNDRGDVAVGRILWRDGVVTEVVTEQYAQVSDLTEDGRVLVTPTQYQPRFPYVWDDGVRTEIAVPPDIVDMATNLAFGMTEDGFVVGGRTLMLGSGEPWWWDGGPTATDLVHPTSPSVRVVDWNEAGQLAGWHGGRTTAFLWEDGTFTDLPVPPGASADARALSDAGHVAGSLQVTPGGSRHAAVWHEGVLTDLGGQDDLPYTVAADVNDAGVVVGYAHDNGGGARGLLWRGGPAEDLGGFGAGRTVPVAINDRAEVIGTSTDADGVVRGVLWRPEA